MLCSSSRSYFLRSGYYSWASAPVSARCAPAIPSVLTKISIRRKRSKLALTMFGTIVILLLLDTAMCILDVNNAIRELTFTLTSTAPLTLAERYDLTSNLPYAVTNSLFAYMVSRDSLIITSCSFYRLPCI